MGQLGALLRSRRRRGARGVGLVEYVLLLGLVAIVAIGALRLFGASVQAKIEAQAKCVESLDCSGKPAGEASKAPALKIDPSVPKAVQEAAKFSPTVRRAIEAMNKYGITITTGTKGGGSFHSNGKLTLDPDNGQDADTFVHEMNHAIYNKEGRHADIAKSTRADYVRDTIAEEIEGSVQGAQAVYELLQAGQKVDKPAFFEAYEKGVADEKTRNPKATPEQLQAAGREALRKRFHDAFYNGEFVTSTTGETYPDYYGKAWDKAHPKKPWWKFW